MAIQGAAKSGFTQEDLAQMGPTDVERLRRMAAALMGRDMEVKSPLQGFAYLGNILAGKINDYRADRAEREGKQGAADAFSAAFPVFPPAPPTPGGGATTAAAGGGVSRPVTAKGEVADYIRQAATARGIDPDIALRVAMSEGGVSDPVRQSLVRKGGRQEPSYGPFQLLIGGGNTGFPEGLGNRAVAAGIDPRRDWKAGVDFALNEVTKRGWGQWYGARNAGITGMAGVGKQARQIAALTGTDPVQIASLDPTSGMTPPAAVGDGTVPVPAARPDVAGTSDQQPAMVAQAQTPDPAATLGAPVYTGPSVNQLGALLGNEWLPEGQQRLVQALIGQQIERQDPRYQMGLEKDRLELDALRNPRMTPYQEAQIAEQKADDARQQATADRLAQAQEATIANQNLDNISGLRKEVQGLPSYKNLAQAAPVYRSMVETAGRDTKASDLNLVYGLAKIMDPGSVVREGEVHMANDTQGLADYLNGIIKGIQGEGRLTPEGRQALMTEAFSRIKAFNDAFATDTQQFRGIIERNKFNAADVLPDFGAFDPWQAGGTPTVPTAPAQADIPPPPPGMDPNVWKFMDPEGRKLWLTP